MSFQVTSTALHFHRLCQDLEIVHTMAYREVLNNKKWKYEKRREKKRKEKERSVLTYSRVWSN